MAMTIVMTMMTVGAALVASTAPVEASTITYSQRFFLTSRDLVPEDPAAPDGLGASPRVERFLSDFPEFLWDVPAFDPSLGTVTSVTLQLQAQASIRGRMPFGEMFAYFDMLDPIYGDPLGQITASSTCASGCKFSGSAVLDWSETVAYSSGDPTIAWMVSASADRFATFEAGAWADIKTASVGVVRAIYTYEPAAAAARSGDPSTQALAATAPEPASLLLCASGLAGLAARARRQRARARV